MVPPDIAALETLSLAELRDLVGTLVAKVADLGAATAALKAENQALRDEVARLKGLPPRPPLWNAVIEGARHRRLFCAHFGRFGRPERLPGADMRATGPDDVIARKADIAAGQMKGGLVRHSASGD
jgi:hypothetical protein